MGSRPMFEVADGWVARGFVFEVETTSPEQPGQVAQAFGARRYAYNWALGQVRANLDARTADPTVPPLAWNFYELRKAWNQAKYEVAPWSRCTSKEAYASGIADLVTGSTTGRMPRQAAARARGSDSRASRPAIGIAVGCGSPRARCAWNQTAAISPCR
jgi:Helix-turn-helix domain